MSLLSHVLWPSLKPYLRVHLCSQSDGGYRHPRIRIEFALMPPDLARLAAVIQMPCVRCGSAINPVRQRVTPTERPTPGSLYYACTCPLSVRMGCARGNAARDEYLKFREYAA